MSENHILYRLEMALWEEAKGKLRAMASMAGGQMAEPDDLPRRYDCLNKVVEDFIKRIESDDIYPVDWRVGE